MNYTVLMLYPDYMQDGGTETYLDQVEAGSAEEAEKLAQRNAAQANELDSDFDSDFYVLYVAEGWHPDVRTFS